MKRSQNFLNLPKGKKAKFEINSIIIKAFNNSNPNYLNQLTHVLQTEELSIFHCSTLLRSLSIKIKNKTCPPELKSALLTLSILAFTNINSLSSLLTEDFYQKEPKQFSDSAAFIIYNLGQLASTKLLPSADLPILASSNVQYLIEIFDQYFSAKMVAICLYGLGLLAKAGKLEGSISAHRVESLLNRLSSLPDIDTQAISNSFYGLGLVAKTGNLKDSIAAHSAQNLLNHLSSLPDIKTQHISNTLYGLSLLAEAGKLKDSITAHSAQNLLNRLSSFRDIKTQDISNTLYGLGLLAKASKLEGSISAHRPESLLHRLSSLPDIDTQAISNSFYGLGLVAEASKLKDSITAHSAQNLLNHLSSLPNIDAQHISNTLYGLGLLAEAGNLQSPIPAGSAQNLLNHLSSLPDIDTQAISNSFYGLGLLAKAEKFEGAIAAHSTQKLLHHLSSLLDVETQHISNVLYGLGLLAKSGKLKGSITARSAQNLLNHLSSRPDIEIQIISNTLYGLGLLAKASKIEGSIAAHSAQNLLNHLSSRPNIDAQQISNTLYGFGLLAEASNLQGSISVDNAQNLLDRLRSCPDVDAQAISNTLYGVGLLAEAGNLQSPIPAGSAQNLLNHLSSLRDTKAREISNTLYGLGLLAKAEKFEGSTAAHSVQNLLNHLSSRPDIDAQHISNTLYGLGLLAKAGKLEGSIAAHSAQNLLNHLSSRPDIDTQAISNTLYGLGLVAKASKLTGSITAHSAQNLLNYLSSRPDIDAQHISNTLYGLGLLAKVDKLEGSITARSAQNLLNHLSSRPDIEIQAISNTLYGLGLLAKASKLEGSIAAHSAQNLLNHLSSRPDIDTQAISNTLYGLGLLAKSGKLEVLKLLESQVLDFLKRLSKSNTSPLDTQQTIQGVINLIDQKCLSLSPAIRQAIKQLFSTAMSASYLHPTQIADLINSVVSLKDYHTEFNNIFMALIEGLAVPITRLPMRLQNQLQEMTTALHSVSDWQQTLRQKLGLQEIATHDSMTTHFEINTETQELTQDHVPLQTRTNRVSETSCNPQYVSEVNQEEWHRASCNQIFQAIDKKDGEALKKLLGIAKELRTPAAKRKPGSVGSNINPSRNELFVRRNIPQNTDTDHAHQIAQVNRLVTEFFTTMPANALRRLISQSESKYFFMLLHTASRHTRFQLAQSKGLHPVLLYLPHNELQGLINQFISPLELYRDHKALLSLIDALVIRFEQNPAQQQSIQRLQSQLLKKALEFHHIAHHHHVVERLTIIEEQIENQTLILLDEESNNESLPPSCPDSLVPAVPQNLRVQENGAAVARQSITTQTNNIAFFTPQILRPSVTSQPLTINPHYEYTSEDIQAILRIRLKTYPQAEVLAAADMNENAEGNRVTDVLGSYFDKNKTDKILLLPIAIGLHWVGLRIEIMHGKITKLVYYNSKQNPARDKPLMATIKNELLFASLIELTLTIRMATINMQQPPDDSMSCGTYLIENFYGSLKKASWSNPSSEKTARLMREKHLKCLKDENSFHYETFLNSQQVTKMQPFVS